jgi:hypothetical protein
MTLVIQPALCLHRDFSRNKIAFQTARADFKRYRRTFDLGLDLFYIRLPGSPCPVLGMAHFVPGYGVLPANIASA